MLKKISSISIALSFASVTGCASILSDSSYPVAITSSPSEASFVVTNKGGISIHSGRTPATVSLKAGDGFFSGERYSISISKDGFDDQIISIETSLDGWYIGNLLFGGLIGFLIVDPMTGAMWKLPDTANASLPEKVVTLILNGHELTIVSLEQLPEQYKEVLEPVTI